MLWLFITVLITVLAFVIAGVFFNLELDELGKVGIAFGAIGIIVLMTMSIAAIEANTDTCAYVASMQQRYEILKYQLENDVYDNLNDIGKRELFEQVRAWNECIANYKELQNSAWVGIFYANVYDQFEFITLQ